MGNAQSEPVKFIPPRVLTDPAAQKKPASHGAHAIVENEIPFLVKHSGTTKLINKASKKSYSPSKDEVKEK